MAGVKRTYWGWAPATGLLYTPFFLYFNFFLIYGLSHLVRVYRGVDSSFRRNRATLIVLGTLVSLAGGFIDFARFILAGFVPAEADRKSTRLNSSHVRISYAVFCLKKNTITVA